MYMYVFFFRMDSLKSWRGHQHFKRSSWLPNCFSKKLCKFMKPSAIYTSPYMLTTLVIPKKTKRLLLRLNKFSVWQPLKDLCLLTTMSVGMCNRNFLYQQKKIVIQFTKRGEKVIWKYKSIVNYQHLWQLLAIYCSLVMCTTTVSN